MADIKESHWLKDSACIDQDLKTFASYDPEDIEKAKTFCAVCPVQRECMMYFHELSAVAAGYTRYERLKLLWKRVDNDKRSNWSSPDKIFPKLFAGKG